MTRDEWVMVAVVVAFAAWITAHITIVVGLLARPPRWRALAAFPVVPLAPFWGLRTGMFLRSAIWIMSAAAYGIARWLAAR
jgi:hypothetical protein